MPPGIVGAVCVGLGIGNSFCLQGLCNFEEAPAVLYPVEDPAHDIRHRFIDDQMVLVCRVFLITVGSLGTKEHPLLRTGLLTEVTLPR